MFLNIHPNNLYTMRRQRLARRGVWLAIVALIFSALSPALLALNKPAQAKVFAQLCTHAGLVKVALDLPGLSIAADHRDGTGGHEQHCTWCSSPHVGLAKADSAGLQCPQNQANGTLTAPRQVMPLTREARLRPWSHGPPDFL